jgi:hypothetical protein
MKPLTTRQQAATNAMRREQEAAGKEHARQLKARAHAKRWPPKKGGTYPIGVCPICKKKPRDLQAHQQIHKKGHSPGFGRDGIPIGKRRAPGSAFAGKSQR